MQNIAQNFVSGIILLMDRSIRPGDVLEVEGRVVRVSDVRIRATVARTRDEEDLIIPNSVLVQSSVKNYTLEDSFYRIRAEVGVHYKSDMDQVFRVLASCADHFDQRSERTPVVMLRGFGASSVDFEVSIWVDTPWASPRIKSQLLLAIWNSLKEGGIEISYPQMDVHLDHEMVAAVAARGGGRD